MIVIEMAGSIDVDNGLVGSGTTSGMPDGGTLQEHFFAISKGITAFGTASASWMKMVVVTGLQDFSRDKSETVGALDAKEILIVLLTVGCAIFAHVLTMQEVPTCFALEAPDMIVLV